MRGKKKAERETRTSELVPGIIFEDNCFLVVDKPSGLVVNRAESVKVPTLQDWVEGRSTHSRLRRDEVRKFASDFVQRSGVVHRLDKDTSGLLLVAKTARSFIDLQGQFKKREVKKTYLVLAHGWIKPREGKIDLPVARNPFNRRKFGVFLTGKKSETSYQTKERFEKGKKELFSLLLVSPKTGRTHQLRVHFKHLNHSLVADPIYTGRKTFRSDEKWCPRLFLHAQTISFTHPENKNKVSFFSPLPGDLKEALKRLVSAEEKQI